MSDGPVVTPLVTPLGVQSAGNYSNPATSLAVTFPGPVTAGNLIVACYFSYILTDSATVTDSQSNTYSERTWINHSSQWSSAIYDTIASVTGTLTVTVTLPAANNYLTLMIAEYSGVNKFDQAHSNTNTGSGGTSGNVTTTQAIEMLVGWATDSGGSLGPASGWTITTGAVGFAMQEFQAVSSIGSYAATYTGGGGGWTAQISTYYLQSGPPIDSGVWNGAGLASLTVAGIRGVPGVVAISGTAAMAVGATTNPSGIVAMSGSASMTVTPLETEVAAVALHATAGMSVISGAVETATVTMGAVAAMTATAMRTATGIVSMGATAGMTVDATEVPLVITVTMGATAGLTVVAGVTTRTAPTLEDSILGVLGQDPIMLGATGYLEDVFTTRLVGDSD